MSQDNMEQCKPCREKYWNELDDSAKIERMRKVIKGYIQALDELREDVLKLRQHDHRQYDGKICIPFKLNEGYGRLSPRASNDNEVYF